MRTVPLSLPPEMTMTHGRNIAVFCIIFIHTVATLWIIKDFGGISTNNLDGGSLGHTPFTRNQPKLRFQWTSLELHSKLAKVMYAHQHNCSVPVAAHRFRSSYGPQGPENSRNYGLGSELHVWGHLALLARNKGVRIRTTPRLDWSWWDHDTCNGTASSSLLACYFPHAETSKCLDETLDDDATKISSSSLCGPQFGETLSVSEERMALTEYLFASVSPLVVHEATKQLQLVFPNGTVPANLITIHIRWGDKETEMQLKSITTYIEAAKKVVAEKQIDTVNILLCTEDPKATVAFYSQIPKDWNVYLDQFYTYMLPFRSENSSYNALGDISMQVLMGKAGLWALGSLLVSMEANIFILTTKSNWSRLMNELRLGIVNPRCNNCTIMVDLGYGEC